LSAKSRRTPKEQVTLEFPDNALLAGLAGAHQKNFVRLEQKLDVHIAMRGNLVAIEGAPDRRERAATVMRALYARLEGGEACSSSDVDAEVRFAGERAAAPVGATFGSPSIRTASSRVTRARSPAQAAISI
jgi:phosphate starvation-inducible PhoH-like protein